MSVSMTAIAWWTSFSNWVMFVSTFDARPVRFLFVIIYIRVCALVLLDGGVSALCVLDLFLCAGALVLIVGLCLFFLILCLATVYCSTLRTTCVYIFDEFFLDCVIELVCRELLLLLFSGTLKLSGLLYVVVGFAAIDSLWWISFSVIRTSCFIFSDPLPLPKFLMALAQSDIPAITLSACVMVGRISFLWLKCTLSMNHSLLVVFMWHLCVR